VATFEITGLLNTGPASQDALNAWDATFAAKGANRQSGPNDHPIIYTSNGPFDADEASQIVGGDWAANVS
jgi:hypothetical protein